ETHNPTPEKTVPNKPTTPNTPDDIIKRLPKTGDGLDPARYAGLFAIPGSILLFFELRRRKNLNK
ncbi:collagen-binding protein, partial [Peptostreptococcus canis]|nr:collagen-binding protein [Peptostreptococcus canis]